MKEDKVSAYSESKIKDLIFNLHRCIETRDWTAAKTFFTDSGLAETLSTTFRPLKTPQRFLGTDTRISLSGDNTATAVVMFLNIGGTEGPRILACGSEHIAFVKNENSEWKISSYGIEADTKMFEEWGVPW